MFLITLNVLGEDVKSSGVLMDVATYKGRVRDSELSAPQKEYSTNVRRVAKMISVGLLYKASTDVAGVGGGAGEVEGGRGQEKYFVSIWSVVITASERHAHQPVAQHRQQVRAALTASEQLRPHKGNALVNGGNACAIARENIPSYARRKHFGCRQANFGRK